MSPLSLERRGHPSWAAPPVRMVHLGLGGFFRAHQAWYTAHAHDTSRWGIAAFSGHSLELPQRLTDQDGLYTLTTRGPDSDSIEVIPSVVHARPGIDTEAWRAAVADPGVELITLTVTEAAYAPGPACVAPRLLNGLAARHRGDAGPITIVSCDNVPDNAQVLGKVLVDEAERRDPDLADWLDASVAIVGSVVDRITPAPTARDVETVVRHGYRDIAPVITEPFTEWVLAGTFAANRPAWESAGALFTDDLGPYTRRKLHLLNGAHTLLAYVGSLRGHHEVADAIADPTCHELVQTWWDEATDFVDGDPVGIRAYRDALIERFANERMHHRLGQIAIDGSVKLPLRVVPVARSERAHRRGAPLAATVVGAWVAFVERGGDSLVDVHSTLLRRAVADAGAIGRDVVVRLVRMIAPDLAEDHDFLVAVLDARNRFVREC